MSNQDKCYNINDFYYLKVIRKLDNSILNETKLVKDLANIFELTQYRLKDTK